MLRGGELQSTVTVLQGFVDMSDTFNIKVVMWSIIKIKNVDNGILKSAYPGLFTADGSTQQTPGEHEYK